MSESSRKETCIYDVQSKGVEKISLVQETKNKAINNLQFCDKQFYRKAHGAHTL